MGLILNGFEKVSHIVTALTLVLGLVQFCSYRSDLKVQRSLDAKNKFYDNSVSDAWGKLSLVTVDREKIEKIMSKLKKGEEAEVEVENYLTNKAKDNEDSWFILLDYFTFIYQCVEKDMCDSSLVGEIILSSGRKFFKNY